MWRTVKRILAGLGVALGLLLLVLIINTFRYTPHANTPVETASFTIDADAATVKLSQAIAIKTISSRFDQIEFDAFLSWLTKAFVQVHQTMRRELLGRFTALYVWPGSDPSLKPILITGHYDVVPVQDETLEQWTHPPFSGALAEGYVWGRGSLDDKAAIVAMLQAAENLIATGFQPKRSIYFSLGHDEEIGGNEGAGAVVRHLKEQGVQFEWSLDEGSFVLDEIIQGLGRPVASINIAEKGILSLHLVATALGGHSSMPPKETAVGIIAAAVDRLQKAPMPGGLSGITADFFDELGRHFGFGRRILFANRWLFEPVLESALASAPTTNALLGTTTAPTMLSGSPAENVLATTAKATINFRIHPRDTIAGVTEYVRKIIDDERIEIVQSDYFHQEASAVSSFRTAGYHAIRQAILATFGNVIAVPGLTIAGTDSHHYGEVALDAYRINPFKIRNEDLPGIHGINERISVENLTAGIRFYMSLLSTQ